MSDFVFDGRVPASKSILNRLLIVQSYFPEFQITGDSDCDDVALMRNGIKNLLRQQTVDCGHSGAVLRFLALRASRISGQHLLVGSQRLFARPQGELAPILSQLGVTTKFDKTSVQVISRGWKLIVDGLQIQSQRSSQFASAVILNSWLLKFPLHFNVGRQMVSAGYFKMTVQLMKNIGMRIEENGSEFFIPANQTLKRNQCSAEPDLSSAFSVAAMAVVAGRATIRGFPAQSSQPDFVFVNILKNMGVNLQLVGDDLVVEKSTDLKGVEWNIISCPDLFPVLGVLCATAKTPSLISGVGHLQFKESSRLEKTQELIQMMGGRCEVVEDRVKIIPAIGRPVSGESKVFKTDLDHRLAMAVEVARRAGYLVHGDDLKVVSKSYPEFLSLVQMDRGEL